jgi:hypothetical protein
VRGALPLAIAGLLGAAGCAGPSPEFPIAAARTHVVHLGAAIGSRPSGTEANRRAREYLVETVSRAGLSVRVQASDVYSPRFNVAGRVHNIIGTREGARRDAIALVAHYDSVPEGSGAADNAFGTAVVIEAARVLARQPDLRWSLMVLLTDGEERGLLGASAVLEDAQVRERLKAVINVESIGNDRPVVLFETGPGNAWLTRAWAASAPAPRGASFNYEIYRRMPNDTDFSVFKRAGIPGLNLAAVGDGYAYHTSAESPARVTDGALAQAGSTIVAVVEALQREDITRRTPDEPTYFDLLGRAAVAWTPATDIGLLSAALAAGVVAFVRAARATVRAGGGRALVLVACWALAGLAGVTAGAVGSMALLRAVREVYHPWYAHPGRFALVIVLSGLAAGWLIGRLAVHLPAGMRLPRHAAVVAVPTLPAWMALAAWTGAVAPRAAYLWVLPLLALSAPVALAGTGRAVMAVASAAALAAAAVLWLPDTAMVFAFMVPLTGRLSGVTPVWVLPSVLLAAAVMVAPPLIALSVAAGAPRLRFATRAVLLSAGFALGWAYWAAAYTPERPLQLTLVSLSGAGGRAGTVDVVAGNEPVPSLGPGAPLLTPVTEVPPRFAAYVGRAPFVSMAPPGPPRESARVECAVDGDHVVIRVVPLREGATARLELPEGIVPAAAEPPGQTRGGGWRSALAALPPEGGIFRVSLPPAAAGRACQGDVAVHLPGPVDAATGRAPGWLAHPGVAWTFRVVDVLPLRYTP